MNKKTLIKVCAVTCGLGLTLAGCTSSNNSNEINNTKKKNIIQKLILKILKKQEAKK